MQIVIIYYQVVATADIIYNWSVHNTQYVNTEGNDKRLRDNELPSHSGASIRVSL